MVKNGKNAVKIAKRNKKREKFVKKSQLSI